MKTNVFFYMIITSILSCAPAVKHIEFSKGKTQFGPSQEDPDIMGGQTASNSLNNTLPTFDQASGTTYDRWQEQIYILANLNSSPRLLESAQKVFEKTQKLKNQKQQNYGSSFYPQLVMSESVPKALPDIDKTLFKIHEDHDLIQKQIMAQPRLFSEDESKNLEKISFTDSAQRISVYLHQLNSQFQSLNLTDLVKASLHKKITEQIQRIQKIAGTYIPAVQNNNQLKSILTIAQTVLKNESIKLDSTSQQMLGLGLKLGTMISSYTDSQGAFSTLIEIWKFLTPAQREMYVKSSNSSLYDFLNGKETMDLNCLQDPKCNGLLTSIQRGIFVLPAIEKYGLEKLRNELNEKSSVYALSQIQKTIAEQLLGINQTTARLVHDEFAAELSQAQNLRDHLATEIPSRFQNAFQNMIPSMNGQIGQLNGYEIYQTKNSSANSDSALQGKTVDISLTVEDIATDFALSARAIKSNSLTDERNQKIILEKIDVLAQFYLQKNNIKMQKYSELPIRAQAEWIRGLSQWAQYFQDWKQNEFNKVFDPIKASTLFPEYSFEELNRNLFPKEAIYAMSLSAIGEGLQTITKSPSPFFIVDTDNKMTWIDQAHLNENGSHAVMVGVVDQSNGTKSQFVRAEDISRYILGLSQFLESIEGIEQSHSKYLVNLQKNSKEAPIEEIKKNKANLKLLILGLANYLSHQMRNPNGLIASALNVKTGLRVGDTETLLDQALAVRSLLAASHSLHVDLYLWEAQDVYFSMNKILFNPKLGFYSQANNSQQMPNLFILTETLHSMSEIKNELNSKSQKQLEWIMHPWIQKLENQTFQFNF